MNTPIKILSIFSLVLCFVFIGIQNGHAYDKTQYQEVLHLTIKFYGAQRCGDTHNWLLTENSYGNKCHMQDGPDLRENLDVTGGWHDAGDYIKFTLTTAWASYALLKGYDAFPDAYHDVDSPDYSGYPNGIPDILDEVKIATDYLIKANPDSNTMIARVGGSQDHDYWVTSPYQSILPVSQGGGTRPVFDGANADICGIAAASLALMSNLYREFNADYADSCLYHARVIYHIGNNNRCTTYDEFYYDNTWKDGMLCGAVEIYRAANDPSFLEIAKSYEQSLGSHWWVVDWGNHLDYGRHSLVKAGYTEALTDWGKDVRRYLSKTSNATYIKGLAYFGDWGSLRYATGAAFSAALYYEVTGDTLCRNFAQSQVEYVMGNNEYNRSFIVGWGQNPPEHPHHANAYGREALDWNLSEDHLCSLDGAIVGGPTRGYTGPSSPGYQDDIEDWVGNEVTIDYNSGLVGATAMIVSEFLTSSNIQPNETPILKTYTLHQNYPNPFNATTNICYALEFKSPVKIVVYNISGQKVKTLVDDVKERGSYRVSFDAQELSSGVYYYQLEIPRGNQVKKFILLK